MYVHQEKFDEHKFELQLDRFNVRIDDYIHSYQSDPHVKPVTKINRLQGERYRTELCQRFGITQEQLQKMFIAKMGKNKQQKLLNLRNRGTANKPAPVDFEFDANVVNFEDMTPYQY